MERTSEGKGVQRRVEEHVREGLYLLTTGKVVEGRREWRRALALQPGHPVALDYLVSTDDELSPPEQRQEREEIDMSTPGAVVDVSEVWAQDDEVTGESIEGQWSRGASAAPDDHVRVRSPGATPAAPARPAAPEVVVEAEGWDNEDTPAVQPSRSSTSGSWDAAAPGARPWGKPVTAPAPPERTSYATPAGGTRRPSSSDSIPDLLSRAQSALKSGDLAAARQGFEAVVARQPGHPEATQGLSQLDERFRQMLIPDAVPVLNVGLDEIARFNLDHIGGFVFSMIDGQTSIEEIQSMTSHLDQSRVVRILGQLVGQGAITLKRP